MDRGRKGFGRRSMRSAHIIVTSTDIDRGIVELDRESGAGDFEAPTFPFFTP